MISLVYLAALFFVLTPGILLTLPTGGSKTVVAATHAVVFVVLVYFTLGFFENMEYDYDESEEGFQYNAYFARNIGPVRYTPPPPRRGGRGASCSVGNQCSSNRCFGGRCG